jgi:hypothetical protein
MQMGTRTVGLDEETEQTLGEIQAATGMSLSAALKRGLFVLRGEVAKEASTAPYDIYTTLDLGPGGYAAGPASEAKKTCCAPQR